MRIFFVVTLVCGGLTTQATAQTSQRDIRLNGMGALHIGMSLQAVNRVLHQHLTLPKDALEDKDSCTMLKIPGMDDFALMFTHTHLSRIETWSKEYTTANGIHPGSSTQEMLKKYASHIEQESNKYDAQELTLTVRSPDGRYALRAETDQGKIAMIYVGFWQEIQYVEHCL